MPFYGHLRGSIGAAPSTSAAAASVPASLAQTAPLSPAPTATVPRVDQVKNLRQTCNLRLIPFSIVAQTVLNHASNGAITRPNFILAYDALMQKIGAVSDQTTARGVFALFDREGWGAMRIDDFLVGIGLLCHGSMEEKLHAYFSLFDLEGNGLLKEKDLARLFEATFRGVWSAETHALVGFTAQEVASACAKEAIKTARGGDALTVTQFKSWFFDQIASPAVASSPLRRLLL
jgi:Ca2+-binding EF-hand superfamily protein